MQCDTLFQLQLTLGPGYISMGRCGLRCTTAVLCDDFTRESIEHKTR